MKKSPAMAPVEDHYDSHYSDDQEELQAFLYSQIYHSAQAQSTPYTNIIHQNYHAEQSVNEENEKLEEDTESGVLTTQEIPLQDEATLKQPKAVKRNREAAKHQNGHASNYKVYPLTDSDSDFTPNGDRLVQISHIVLSSDSDSDEPIVVKRVRYTTVLSDDDVDNDNSCVIDAKPPNDNGSMNDAKPPNDNGCVDDAKPPNDNSCVDDAKPPNDNSCVDDAKPPNDDSCVDDAKPPNANSCVDDAKPPDYNGSMDDALQLLERGGCRKTKRCHSHLQKPKVSTITETEASILENECKVSEYLIPPKSHPKSNWNSLKFEDFPENNISVVSLADILSKLPADGWDNDIHIDDRFRRKVARRYYNSRCGNCFQLGHKTRLCPQPRKVRLCVFCAEPHPECQVRFDPTTRHRLRCPSKRCFYCNENHPRFRCKRLSFLPGECKRCHQYGHETKKCHELWRQWSNTYDPHSTDPTPFTDSLLDLTKAMCSLCARSGHFNYACPMNRATVTPVLNPWITSFISQHDGSISGNINGNCNKKSTTKSGNGKKNNYVKKNRIRKKKETAPIKPVKRPHLKEVEKTCPYIKPSTDPLLQYFLDKQF